ncbi:MAG: hypothetical protein ACK4M9_11155 [Anaerobacillus sp.]|uniref:hypothetical protein n=1 Tax=Anaerobacillus sp. TaxID=1872506 RepID=UPI00391D1367
MVYVLIALTIFVYFLIVIRIFHGINDSKTVSFISRIKSVCKTIFGTINTQIK